MTAILDQKHYIEELNRHLSGTVTDLQAKMDSLEKTNSKLVEEVRRALCVQLWDCVRTGLILFNISLCVCVCVFSPLLQLTAATDRINSLREEQEQLKKENETILQSSQRKEEVWGGGKVSRTNCS